MEYRLEDELHEPAYDSSGFCWILRHTATQLFGQNKPLEYYRVKDYPEIAEYKPNESDMFYHNNGWYWFPRNKQGQQKRLNIIREIIEKLKENVSS